MQTKLPAPMDDLLTGPVPSLVIKQVRLVDAMLTKLEGARFKIVLPDGSEFTHNLEEAPPPKEAKRREGYTFTYPRGTLHAIYQPLIQNLKLGELVEIAPPEGIDVDHLRAAAAGWASKNWGTGCHTSEVSERTGHITFMRTG